MKFSEPVKKKTKGDWETVPSDEASFNNGKVRVKKDIVENAITEISRSLSEDYKSEKRKKALEDRKKWDAEHDAWQKKQEQERAKENHIGKSFSIKSGHGYWDITNYPIGGNFKRAGAEGVIAKVDSHLPDHIASHHQVNVTGKTKEGRTIAFNTRNADNVNE